ncbi:hypothetical protein, partial [Variovorax sp. YR266]|uniref:hypothetical protein n=1 Tax=Variovorax sp. YR266 TaxID=1884386 RepID=UPI001C40916F
VLHAHHRGVHGPPILHISPQQKKRVLRRRLRTLQPSNAPLGPGRVDFLEAEQQVEALYAE